MLWLMVWLSSRKSPASHRPARQQAAARRSTIGWPALDGVRIDHGIIAGVDVPAHYDSMMAKLIAWGEDREQARQRLRRALEHIKLLGPLSNRTLLI